MDLGSSHLPFCTLGLSRIRVLLIATLVVSGIFYLSVYNKLLHRYTSAQGRPGTEYRITDAIAFRGTGTVGASSGRVLPVEENDTKENRYENTTTNEVVSASSLPVETPPSRHLRLQLQAALRKATEKKIILLWYKYSEEGISSNINGSECGNCGLTSDQRKINDSSTGAVLFHSSRISPETMPSLSHRNPDQLYIFWSNEPTPIVKYQHKRGLKYEDKYGFNASMSYREDSDFYGPYLLWLWDLKLDEAIRKDPRRILDMKSGIGAAALSNCANTAGAKLRMLALSRIRDAGLPFDGYGKCFRDSQEKEIPRTSWQTLLETLKPYKFYFAFENSYHCRNYVTEKLFRNAFFAYAVPIVFGATREDYQKLAPEGSYIFLEDFASIEKLVEYLKYLDKNDTAYLEYFRWHQTFNGKSPPERAVKLCQICRALHGINYDDAFNPKRNLSRPLFTSGVSRRMVALESFMYGRESEECLERDVTKLRIPILPT